MVAFFPCARVSSFQRLGRIRLKWWELAPTSVFSCRAACNGVLQELRIQHLTERDMAADPMTKYLTYGVWSRHMHYVLNKMGPLPPYPSRRE